MITSKHLGAVLESLKGLGVRRLIMLAVVGTAVMAAVGLAVHQLSRPAMQAIYTGLSPQDVGRMTAALSEAGLAFDVNEQRSSILVPYGQVMRARVLLAQRGLPTSTRAGYELFDQMGSMGLTSFMQEVTRVRALEGEIARTIQAIEGVAAARIHLVLADAGSFRRERREGSASVLLKLDGNWQSAAGQAVRHIVASAVPGMKLEHVSVASTDGRMIATAGDEQAQGSTKQSEMERSMARELEQKANRTLVSSLGSGNFQVSITVRLDIDRQQINETVFDPASRIERSMRVVKQSGSSEEANAKSATGVEANLPRPEPKQTDADKRRQREDRREELVNYELSSKSVQTVREGYRMRRLAIAVVVNKKQLKAELGDNADQAAFDARLGELKRLIAAATGADGSVESSIEISASEFSDAVANLPPTAPAGIVDYLLLNIGSIVSAVSMLGVVLIVVLVGLRPLLVVLGREPSPAPPALGVPGAAPSPRLEATTNGSGAPLLASQDGSRPSPGVSASSDPNGVLRTRLEALVAADEVKAARVLKNWIAEAR